LTERLTKDFFTDPSDASVSCAKTGTIQIADNIATGKSGEVSSYWSNVLWIVCMSLSTRPIPRNQQALTTFQLKEVFEESRSLLFKTLRVQRIYDQEKNTMVYVSFNTRLDKNDDTNKSRFKSSLCAVSLD
jgi:catabolite regulation protein CreA